MKKTLSALLAMFLSLNLFVSAVPVLETHVEAASKQTEYAEEATLAEDGITYMWDFEDASSQVWKCNNQGYSITYEDGKMKVAVDPERDISTIRIFPLIPQNAVILSSTPKAQAILMRSFSFIKLRIRAGAKVTK